MANQNFTRKLTAILTADVKGYSRLMGEDEMETVRTITTYREAMCTLIQDHRGRCQYNRCSAVCCRNPEGLQGQER